MYEEFDMDFEDEEQCGVNEGHVDCSDAFNTSQVMMFINPTNSRVLKKLKVNLSMLKS